MNKTERAIQGFGCPKCGVKAGEKCRRKYKVNEWSQETRYYETYRPHNERLVRLDRMDIANEAKAAGVTQRELRQLRAGTHHSQRTLAAEKAALYEFKLRELEQLRDWLVAYGDVFEVKKRRKTKQP